MAIPGYDNPEKAQKLIDDTKALVVKYQAEGMVVPAAPVKATEVKSTGDAKSQADQRLKAELAALSSSDKAESDAAKTAESQGE